MKRIAGVLLAVILLLLATATAEQSFDSMSDAELKSLYESVNNEMRERELLSVGVLNAGQYIAGTDIVEGTYSISSPGTSKAYYFVFPSQELYDDFNKLKLQLNIMMNISTVSEDQPVRIVLKNNAILYIPQGSVKIERIYDALSP